MDSADGAVAPSPCILSEAAGSAVLPLESSGRLNAAVAQADLFINVLRDEYIFLFIKK